MTISLPLLERRTIEASVLAPMIRAFASEFGEARTFEIVRKVIAQFAQHAGTEAQASCGGNGILELWSVVERWKAGDALTLEVLQLNEDRLEFNVVRCRFAEMYRQLDIPELGALLSCDRDAAMVEGFNPTITLTRTQTLMEGASHCDFRFAKKAPRQDEG